MSLGKNCGMRNVFCFREKYVFCLSNDHRRLPFFLSLQACSVSTRSRSLTANRPSLSLSRKRWLTHAPDDSSTSYAPAPPASLRHPYNSSHPSHASRPYTRSRYAKLYLFNNMYFFYSAIPTASLFMALYSIIIKKYDLNIVLPDKLHWLYVQLYMFYMII